jgi:hypothetical protein
LPEFLMMVLIICRKLCGVSHRFPGSIPAREIAALLQLYLGDRRKTAMLVGDSTAFLPNEALFVSY